MNGYVVARLQGGMGNQMFEYAFARALSLRGGMDIFIDTAGLNPKKHSGFSLDRFEISAKFVDKDRKNAVITPLFELKRRLYKALKIPYRLSASHIREKSFGFEPTYRQIKTSCYLEGLWQSEKYFSDFSAQISAEFKLKDEESLMRHPLFEQIKNSNSVAVHVRRGDYVSKPKYRKILYVCRKKYYENALNFISERVENARFFVASDDPKWVRENFAGKNITFIEPSGHFEDFYLMSQCRHAVISNSTFSWWSAWLGEARDHNRIIAAPDVWFTPQSKLNFSDIIPNRWIKLPTGCGSADA